MVCGGFLSSSSGACVSIVHLEFVETWILVFLTLCWHLPSQPASQPGIFSLTITEVCTHDVLPVKSSGCFAILRLMLCPYGPVLWGPLWSLFLLLADNPQWLLGLKCRWRAGLSPLPQPRPPPFLSPGSCERNGGGRGWGRGDKPRPPPFLSQGSCEATQLLNPRCRHHRVSRLLVWLPYFCLHLWSYPFGGTPIRPSFWFVV